MKIDVVIPVTQDTRNHVELRYAIKSIKQYFDDLGRIVVVGVKPTWLQDDIVYLKAPDHPDGHPIALWEKLRQTLPTVSDTFVFWSDDQVALHPFTVKHLGPYRQPMETRGVTATMQNTQEYLTRNHKTSINSAVHFPLLMEKSIAQQLIQKTSWQQPPGLCLGTMYLNWSGKAITAPPLDARYCMIDAPMEYQYLRKSVSGRWWVTWTAEAFNADLQRLIDELLGDVPIKVTTPPTLSIIIPTIGRPTLRRTLESIKAQQLIDGDEVILVQDGPADESVKNLLTEYQLPGWYDATGKQSHDAGATPRNYAMPRAKGKLLLFMDDDDRYLPNAFQEIRKEAQQHPKRPLMFRMYHRDTVLWRIKELRRGNVSTQMGCIPNEPNRLAWWPPGSTNDYQFFRSTLNLWPPASLIWCPEIIAAVDQIGTPSVQQRLQRTQRRHLLYHIYPRQDNEEWRLNVQALCRYWSVFNAKKIIGVALDAATDDLSTVQQAFPDDPNILWVPYDNQPSLGEVPTFRLISLLHTYDHEATVFYAHAKGVATLHSRNLSLDQQEHVLYNIRQWRDWMYRGCLAWPRERLMPILWKYACAGCFRIPRIFRGMYSNRPSYWHFSGTFFWINLGRYFSNPQALWLDNDRWAVERHLGQIFPKEESFCFLGDDCTRGRAAQYYWTEKEWDTIRREFLSKQGTQPAGGF
ncbi:MAG TPA: glycosyltransferase family A protein [Myxococcota bacterium]|nr:glycosyltransferase family A protein [Myxococcota bacterium]